MNPLLVALFMFALNFVGFDSAFAHKPSDSYLRVTVHEDSIEGQWDMALRDLEYAIGLDGNANGEITWGEMRSRHTAIAGYALSRLRISNQDSACWNNVTGHLLDHHSDGAYAVLEFSSKCRSAPTTLTINYGLLFDVDPLHRGLLRVEHRGHTQTAIFSPEQPQAQFDLFATSKWREFLQFVHEGAWHIWIGYDHILFLISLLLPAVLWWQGNRWEPLNSFSRACAEVLKIVTSFTVAHSLTLSLSAMNFVTLPSRWVESVIAASVVIAALHNLYPMIPIRRWIVAFGFGLIHGFGFASVLAELALPTSSMFVALGGFNLGVELGQIAIVGLFLPLAYVLRQSWGYRLFALQFGSVCIAGLASMWLIERSLNISLTNWLW